MSYTREQLIKAQIKYNQDYLDNPEYFSESEATEDSAEATIDHLLSFVETND